MAQVINTNVLSLTAQRNLSSSQSQLATSLQRLSSGLRINSAKDDAAGLAISERFTTQIRGLNQAIRNANDGISLSQTAESALNEVNNNLQRIRELAVQSANATNSNSDRATLDQEVEQRLAEINRIANQTSFNGRNVLDGSFGGAVFQVGANVGQTIELSLTQGVRTADIGAVASVTSEDAGFLNKQVLGPVASNATLAAQVTSSGGAVTTPAESGTFTLNIGGIVIDVALAASSTALDTAAQTALVASALDGKVGDLNNAGFILQSTGGTVLGSGDITAANLPSLTVASARGDAFTITQGTTGDVSFELEGVDALTAGQVAATSIDLLEGSFTIQIGDDADNTVSVAGGTYTSQGFVDAINTALAGNGSALLNKDGTFTVNAEQAITITVGGSGGIADFFSSGSPSTAAATGDLTTVNVRTVDAANDALLRIDSALTAVADLRSNFGAIQNRFESTIANLTTTSENLAASRSRIRDADFAAETAELTRLQILQQAGTSVLAQANVAPQSVLALLQ